MNKCNEVIAYKDQEGRLHSSSSSCNAANKRIDDTKKLHDELRKYEKWFPRYLGNSRYSSTQAQHMLYMFLEELIRNGYRIKKEIK